MKYIEVRNLKYKNDLNGISFCLNEKWNSFYGEDHNIISILMGKKEYEGYINIDGNFLSKNSISNLSKKMYLVSKKNIFAGNNLYEELLMSGNDKNLIDNYIINFGLSNYKYMNINNIPFDKKIVVFILFGVLKKIKFIFLDNVLCFLSSSDRDSIYSFLIKNNIIVLNFTKNPEELIYSSKVIKIPSFLMCDTKDINDIKIIDLCKRLIDYGILDEKYMQIEEVVSNL